MTEQPTLRRSNAAARQDKLAAIAALFGEAVATRLAAETGQGAAAAERPGAGQDDRLAWQTNRLIRHLRERVEPAQGGRDPDAGAAPAAPPAPRGPGRIPVLAEGEDLAAEHPAVIAHMLRSESQEVRVAVLRALPGQVARAVMCRLRPE
jgi:hypothetical protein